MLGYLNGISCLGYDFQSYPNSQKISLNILTYPYISYHIPTYPKISSGRTPRWIGIFLPLIHTLCSEHKYPPFSAIQVLQKQQFFIAWEVNWLNRLDMEDIWFMDNVMIKVCFNFSCLFNILGLVPIYNKTLVCTEILLFWWHFIAQYTQIPSSPLHWWL